MNANNHMQVQIYKVPEHQGLPPKIPEGLSAGIDCSPDIYRAQYVRYGDGKKGQLSPTNYATNSEFVCINSTALLELPLGFKIAIPHGFVGLLVPRSSMGHKTSLALGNTVGIIDADYRGEVCARVEKRFDDWENNKIYNKQYYFQLVIVPCFIFNHSTLDWVKDEEGLGNTARATGGFGSTDSTRASEEEDRAKILADDDFIAWGLRSGVFTAEDVAEEFGTYSTASLKADYAHFVTDPS